MIDFEKELKQYEPSQEVGEFEETIRKRDLSDLTDIMIKITEAAKNGELK